MLKAKHHLCWKYCTRLLIVLYCSHDHNVQAYWMYLYSDYIMELPYQCDVDIFIFGTKHAYKSTNLVVIVVIRAVLLLQA